MIRIDIKPLSVNEAWKGRRFKTSAYKSYERSVLLMLKPFKIPDGFIELKLVFGFSSSGSDTDNPIKPFVDCLQKKYGFNDNRIKRYIIESCLVKQGKEFIDFSIRSYE